MRLLLLLASLIGSVAHAAPIPKSPPPDHFDKGYMGIYPIRKDGKVTAWSVIMDSPAYEAGIREMDRIVRIGTNEIRTTWQIEENVWKYRPGAVVEVEVVRQISKIRLVFDKFGLYTKLEQETINKTLVFKVRIVSAEDFKHTNYYSR